jgi:alkylation response protein AidB-like acyl-CoA dehydrogenase
MGGADLERLVALLRTAPAHVQADAVIRDRLATLAIEATALRWTGARLRSPGLVADRPQALPLMSKLVATEHAQRVGELGCEVAGYTGTLWGEWPHSYMSSFAGTIAGGTSEILRNVLGEKVLGLPKTR